MNATYSTQQKHVETCRSPATDGHDDIPECLRQGQGALASRRRSGNSVSLILVRSCWYAIRAEGWQSLPTPGRAGPGTSLAVPASPRSSRKDLDGLDTPRSECVEESKSLKDPGVGARAHTSGVRCPADSTDRPGELEFAFASSLSLVGAGARAVDRDDRRPIHSDEVVGVSRRLTSYGITGGSAG